jgi:hypothetical protein
MTYVIDLIDKMKNFDNHKGIEKIFSYPFVCVAKNIKH